MKKEPQDYSGRFGFVWFSVFQDVMLSLLGSLLAILIIRWVSEPSPGYIFLVLKWLAAALAGTAAGIAISGCSKDVKRYSTVRSMARVVVALLIEQVFMLIALLCNFVVLQMTLPDVLAILLDLLLTGVALSYIRVSARLMSGINDDIPERAARKTALVAGISEPSLRLAADIRKEGYDVVGLLSRDKSMEGRVIRDYVVYCCGDFRPCNSGVCDSCKEGRRRPRHFQAGAYRQGGQALQYIQIPFYAGGCRDARLPDALFRRG